jgi:hypothetical protein
MAGWGARLLTAGTIVTVMVLGFGCGEPQAERPPLLDVAEVSSFSVLGQAADTGAIPAAMDALEGLVDAYMERPTEGATGTGPAGPEAADACELNAPGLLDAVRSVGGDDFPETWVFPPSSG